MALFISWSQDVKVFSIHIPSTNTIADYLRPLQPEIVLNVALYWMLLSHVMGFSGGFLPLQRFYLQIT